MYNYNSKLNERAKKMRLTMTPQENKLWHQYLKNYTHRFRRQRIIGNYIADFYCSKAKLIIEVDGNHHLSSDTAGYDKIRTDFFNSLGIKVLRVDNGDVNFNFEAVCAYIDGEVKNRINI